MKLLVFVVGVLVCTPWHATQRAAWEALDEGRERDVRYAGRASTSLVRLVMVKPFVEHSGAARFGDERRPAREPDLGDATVWLAAELSILGQMRPSFFTSRVMLSVEPPAAWRCGARRGARRVCDRRALSGGAGGCTRVPSGRAAWPAPRHS
jgi:hypothetical protein